MSDPIRVVVADDNAEIRESLAMLLGVVDGIELVGAVSDGEQAVRAAETLHPDVIVMDVRMPNMDGIEAAGIIASKFPNVAVIMHSAFAERSFVAHSVDVGAVEYLFKGSSARVMSQKIFDAAARIVA